MIDLSEIKAMPLDPSTKGLPGGNKPFPLRDTAAHGWNVLKEDLPLPLAILKESAIENNSRWMTSFLESSGVDIALHGKTTMASQLFQRQLVDGAWGITLADVSQIQVARHFGIKRILLANQLIGRQAIRHVADELRTDPGFEFFCLVDSLCGVHALTNELGSRPPSRPLQVLLEGGFRGGRTRCRTRAVAREVAEAVSEASPLLALRGVEGFEGAVSGETPKLRKSGVIEFLQFLVQLAAGCEDAGLFAEGEVLLTAGGSAFYDLVIKHFKEAGLRRAVRIVTRSGCYLTHDSGIYTREFSQLHKRLGQRNEVGTGLRPALEVWGYVQSRPEDGLTLVNLGKRDVSYDVELPIAERWHRPGATKDLPRRLGAGHVVLKLNDQHGFLRTPVGSPLEVGDMVGSAVSHPCTTVDKWRVIPVVNDRSDVLGMIRTCF